MPDRRTTSDTRRDAALLDRPTVDLPDAARLLGISRGMAYKAANDGTLPVLTFGRRKVVPTAHLRRLLGIDAG